MTKVEMTKRFWFKRIKGSNPSIPATAILEQIKDYEAEALLSFDASLSTFPTHLYNQLKQLIGWSVKYEKRNQPITGKIEFMEVEQRDLYEECRDNKRVFLLFDAIRELMQDEKNTFIGSGQIKPKRLREFLGWSEEKVKKELEYMFDWFGIQTPGFA
ncbi:hypothetical protein [Treponema sp. R6D11]